MEEDIIRGILGGVSSDGKWSSKIREVEDRFQQEVGFNGVKPCLASRESVPGEVLLS